MTEPEKTGYGLRDGQLVHVADVERGLHCNCNCVACGLPLVARKGPIRRHYFAHRSNTNCEGAAETVLHRLCKELFLEIDAFAIPKYEFRRDGKTKSGTVVTHQQIIVKGGNVKIDKVRLEAAEVGFVPDIVITSGEKELVIEVAVTHRVDRAKMRHIRRRGLPAIEIRLDLADALLEKDLLLEKIRDDLRSKHWLFHPAQRAAEQTFFKKLREIRAAERVKKISTAQPAISERKKISPLVLERRAPPPLIAFKQQTLPPLSEYDRTVNEFYRLNKRHPTAEECIRLWPLLWKKL